MKYIFLLVTTVLIFGCQSKLKDKTEEINVLFIGNSLTYYHDMPQTVQDMLDETHPNFKIDQSTFPGMSLTAHLENIIESSTKDHVNTRKKEGDEKTETEIKIGEKKWDVLILQDGTVRFLIPESREFLVNTAISEIKSLVKNPKCQFIIFSTWPSKSDYPKEYCYLGILIDNSLTPDQKYCSPIIKDVDQEIKLINEAYQSIADKNNMVKTDNGSVFFRVYKEHTEFELLEDPIHPSELGAFLNACIFYQILTGEKASDLKYDGKIEPKIAKKLKKLAGYNYR
jgi:hypothetical protein